MKTIFLLALLLAASSAMAQRAIILNSRDGMVSGSFGGVVEADNPTQPTQSERPKLLRTERFTETEAANLAAANNTLEQARELLRLAAEQYEAIKTGIEDAHSGDSEIAVLLDDQVEIYDDPPSKVTSSTTATSSTTSTSYTYYVIQ